MHEAFSEYTHTHTHTQTVAGERPHALVSSLRPHTLGAEGLIHEELKASYTSSLRPHTLGAEGLIHRLWPEKMRELNEEVAAWRADPDFAKQVRP